MHIFADSKRRPIDTPATASRIADSHLHLTMVNDPVFALARAPFAGVDFVVTVLDPTELPGSSPEIFFRWLDAVQAEAREVTAALTEHGWQTAAGESGVVLDPVTVRVTAGCHPHNASKLDDEVREVLRSLLAHPMVTVIGEIGLDFYYDFSPRDAQRSVFEEQLILAHELRMPATLHIRDAHDEAISILRSVGVPPRGCVLHCFGEDEATLAPFLELGCHVSYAGPVTFRKSETLRRTLVSTPIDRILTETDAPFMSPEPLRGMESEPAFTLFTARRIAEVRAEALGEPIERTLAALHENARRIYGGSQNE